ncbi:Transcriptional regulator AcuR [BD1-7 clade bacterium]|uniref:Transcriptional regulator AcuR n=1 Tax=BD1-7 clade bacterium TaxID=2029982 RepID=A0A5S9QMZ7_9GAMM|nr:Transcriptional regulator AcuR [BD1-7 clade bacterium]CAA0120488.1 Transcriptional regulator AcuR [BD1-7 clade bacterium]
MPEKSRAGRPRGSKKEDTLKRLLPEARKQFSEKGYAQTTFKDVGKAIGVSHAALYSYFSSKMDLYLATVEDTQAQLFHHYLDAFEMEAPLKDKISHVLMSMAREHDKDPTITGLLAAIPIEMRRHSELEEALVDTNNAIMSGLVAMFEEAKAEGEIISDASGADLISALLGGGVGVALFGYGMPDGDLTSRMEVFVSLIQSQLFKPN